MADNFDPRGGSLAQKAQSVVAHSTSLQLWHQYTSTYRWVKPYFATSDAILDLAGCQTLGPI